MTVSELNAEVRGAVERQFASVWVEGEIVNFTAHGSGHWYFNLNDGSAQIKCVCWKGTNYRIRFKPQNGITVRIRGRISFYEARGETQLVVESLEPSGEGALAAAYEQIRSKLDGEGLFAQELKRPIPFLPRQSGCDYEPNRCGLSRYCYSADAEGAFGQYLADTGARAGRGFGGQHSSGSRRSE